MCYPVPFDPDNSRNFVPVESKDEFLVHFYSGEGTTVQTQIANTQNFGRFVSTFERPELQFRDSFDDIPVEVWGKLQIQLKEAVGCSEYSFIFSGRISPKSDWSANKIQPAHSHYLHLYRLFTNRLLYNLSDEKLTAQHNELFNDINIRRPFLQFLETFTDQAVKALEKSWKIASPAIVLIEEPYYLFPQLSESIFFKTDLDEPTPGPSNSSQN